MTKCKVFFLDKILIFFSIFWQNCLLKKKKKNWFFWRNLYLFFLASMMKFTFSFKQSIDDIYIFSMIFWWNSGFLAIFWWNSSSIVIFSQNLSYFLESFDKMCVFSRNLFYKICIFSSSSNFLMKSFLGKSCIWPVFSIF